MTGKKRIKCYGRVKTRALDSSAIRAVFDAAESFYSFDNQPKINKPPDPESFNIELFTTCIEELSQKKVKKQPKMLLRPKVKYATKTLFRNRQNSNSSNISLFNESSYSKKIILNKIYRKDNSKQPKKRSKVKPKKYINCFSEIQSTSSKKKLRIKETRKNKKEIKYMDEPIQVSSSICEPNWVSITEHSLHIEKPLKEMELSYFSNKELVMKLNVPLTNEETDLPSNVNFYHIEKTYTNMEVTDFDFKKNHLILSASRNEPNLSNINRQILNIDVPSQKMEIIDPNNERTLSKSKTISKNVESAEISKNNLFKSSTPISKCHRSDKAQKALSKAHSQNFKIATSTPALHKEVHKPFTPLFNVSRISKFSEKDDLGSNVLFPSTNITQFSLASKKMASAEENDSDNISGLRIDCATEHNSNAPTDKNNMNMNNSLPLLPLTNSNASNKKLACSSILQKHFETTCHQFSRFSSRSLEMHSTDLHSSKRNIRSSIEVDSFCTSSKSLDKNLECDLSKLLEFCQQDVVIGFEDVFDWSQTSVRKIGEGTYGEVFMVTRNRYSSVLKIIPFAETSDDNSMQTIETVFSEMKVAHCLSELRTDKSNQTKNFNKLRSAKVATGCYPNKLIDAWDAYSIAKATYNSCPDIFEENQMFAILELEYGGKDMTEFVMKNATEAEFIFKQIAISLAIAEEAHLFEHRDLHLGNILVQRNNSKEISYILRGKPFTIQSLGLVVSIIDFTLSRVLDEGCVFYNDLANDESLFNQSGDYQFEVYKLTRQHLNNEWKKSILYSNVLWLNFLCIKLLKHEGYTRTKSKKHLESLKNISTIQNELFNCQSALDVLQNLQIIDSVPKRSKTQGSQLRKTTKYFDRNSTQKSISRINA